MIGRASAHARTLPQPHLPRSAREHEGARDVVGTRARGREASARGVVGVVDARARGRGSSVCFAHARARTPLVRAQFSVEFSVAAFFLLVTVSLLYIYVMQKTVEQSELSSSLALDSVCADVANQLSLASQVRGYNASLTMPPSVGGASYTFTVYNRTVSASASTGRCYAPLVLSSIKKNAASPPFSLSPGALYRVWNNDGVVTVVG